MLQANCFVAVLPVLVSSAGSGPEQKRKWIHYVDINVDKAPTLYLNKVG